MNRFFVNHWWLGCLVLVVLSACGQPDKPAPPPAIGQQDSSSNRFEHQFYPTAAAALTSILAQSTPRVIGFGEFHQLDHTQKTVSSLKRFADQLLPVIAGGTSDLILETWVSEGKCGETEVQVVADVEEVSQRPATTEDETIGLLKRAKRLNVTPHILELKCADYEKVKGDGGVDYLAMLELIKSQLEQKGRAVLKRRAAPGDRQKMIAIYGGAIHNDAAPAPEWASVSFGPGLGETTGRRYLEIDLYVPEFIENSAIAKAEPWFPLFERLVSTTKVLLIKRGPNAYIIVYKKGVSTVTSAQPVNSNSHQSE